MGRRLGATTALFSMEGLSGLGPPERLRQVATFAMVGYKNAQIGQQLIIAPDTVKTYLSHLFNEFDRRGLETGRRGILYNLHAIGAIALSEDPETARLDSLSRLTTTEMRLIELLRNGQTLDSAAIELGEKHSTVKSRLQDATARLAPTGLETSEAICTAFSLVYGFGIPDLSEPPTSIHRLDPLDRYSTKTTGRPYSAPPPPSLE